MQQTPPPHAQLARNWRRYLRFWGPRAEADVDDELRFHFDMRVRDHVARGMSETDARAAVLERLGDLAGARQQCVAVDTRRHRRMARAQVIDNAVQDVRFAMRGFVRQKGWTFVAVLTLALGIGANSAVFSAVNSLILNPLPYPGADRLALIWLEPAQESETGMAITVTPNPPVAKAWLEHARGFEALHAYYQGDVTVSQRGEAAVHMNAAYVFADFPSFAGQSALHGRMFTPEEVAAREPVAVLSEAVWRRRYGADPDVLGRVLTIDDRAHTVIGVLPNRLTLPRLGVRTPELWLPLQITPDRWGLMMVGRLAPGVTLEQGARELDAIAAQSDDPTTRMGRFKAALRRPADTVPFKQPLLLLMGAVGLVLLIACVNVAHLLLARSAARQRELAIRRAVGAGTTRLLRQLTTETLALAAAGCAAGLLIGWLGLRAIVALHPPSLAALAAARLDQTVLLATIGISVLTGIGFGLFAAIQAARQATHESLKSGALTASHSRRQHRLRSVLVVTEMALSATLLIGAALLVRSVVHLYTSDTGYDPRGLYAVKPALHGSRYPDAASRRAFHQQLLERVQGAPGVLDVAVATSAPPELNFMIGAMQLEGEPAPAPGTTGFVPYNAVSPSYFGTMRLPIVEGRVWTDTTVAGREVMINQGFARKHWPDGSPIGRRLRLIGFDGRGEWRTVSGVVADAATVGLTYDRTRPIVYMPRPDMERPVIIARVQPGTDGLLALRSIVASLDPELAPPTLSSIEHAMSESAALPRFMMVLLVSFTALALLLAAVGLYGVMAYGVAQRTREIGIRIALGASRGDVSRAIVVNGVVLACIGAALGGMWAFWATKLLESQLHGISRTDPVSFAVGAAVLLLTAILACVIPMNRAASVDPVIAMRAE